MCLFAPAESEKRERRATPSLRANTLSALETNGMSASVCDIAMEILRATNDGNDLDPRDLKLLELAVNGFLSEQGDVAFYELHRRAQNGYTKPWLHGIEHLTITHDGYVHWKGAEVEHYDIPWAYGEEAKAQAEELARRCRVLEARGEKPTFSIAFVKWEE
jgi:hypothetical protein